MIASAGPRAELPNGAADLKNFEASRKDHTDESDRTPYAALKMRDNLYQGNAAPGTGDYQPGQVAEPPYHYAYDPPTDALAQRIRTEAGNTLLRNPASRQVEKP